MIIINFSRPPKGCNCSPLFLAGNSGTRRVFFSMWIDANGSTGGITCKHRDVWYHRDCVRLNLSSFNRLASPSRILNCYKCSSKNFYHFPFHYSQLYLTVSNSFDPLSDTNFTFELDSFSSTIPILSSQILCEPPVQNMASTSTQAKPLPAFFISNSEMESPLSVLTPELSSDFIYPKKGSNWVLL